MRACSARSEPERKGVKLGNAGSVGRKSAEDLGAILFNLL